VTRCKKLGDRITCEILITNNAADRKLGIHNRAWTVNLGGTRLIDDVGNVYNDPQGHIGSKELGTDQTVFVTDVPVKSTIYFEGIAAETKGIKLLALECITSDERDYKYFLAHLRDIPLEHVRPKGQASPANESHSITTKEITFSIESCRRVGTSLVCALVVTNESSQDKTLLFDATCKSTKPRLIDDFGSEYGPRWATLGKHRITSGVSPVCHTRQPLNAGETLKGEILFENVDVKSNQVKLIRLTMRLDEINRFYVDLKDIPISTVRG
jgi:hypothetical protein